MFTFIRTCVFLSLDKANKFGYNTNYRSYLWLNDLVTAGHSLALVEKEDDGVTKKELLSTYRAKVIELDELSYQLKCVGTDGRPDGCRTVQFGGVGRGTNDPVAAAIQLADGLEALVCRKEEELQALAEPMERLLGEISDVRTYLIVQHYYVMGQTDEEIGMRYSMSRTRVNQVRRLFLKSL